MSVVPKKSLEKIQWYENHIPTWETNFAAIGTTSAAVAALETKTQAARTAFDAQKVAQDAAKAATETYAQAVDQMSIVGSAILDQIRAAAKVTGPGVYPLAQIPAPATPTPVGAPGKPTDFAVELLVNGALSLKWKCNNPAGCTNVQYMVWRKIGTGEFAFIGGCGSREFVDGTVPVGSAHITYQMQATRSTAVGPWAQFNVNFGTGSNTAVVTEAAPVKIAA
jgi:hypothetical protein